MTDPTTSERPDSTSEARQTRAEELRDTFLYNGKWHATNNAELGTSRTSLLSSIERLEADVLEKARVADLANRKFEAARKAHNLASGDLYTAKRDLDIVKLALADQMEIPS